MQKDGPARQVLQDRLFPTQTHAKLAKASRILWLKMQMQAQNPDLP
jgi:hypothetical protein